MFIAPSLTVSLALQRSAMFSAMTLKSSTFRSSGARKDPFGVRLL
jgi:hypothetical protein